jgi:hypothetical protein
MSCSTSPRTVWGWKPNPKSSWCTWWMRWEKWSYLLDLWLASLATLFGIQLVMIEGHPTWCSKYREINNVTNLSKLSFPKFTWETRNLIFVVDNLYKVLALVVQAAPTWKARLLPPNQAAAHLRLFITQTFACSLLLLSTRVAPYSTRAIIGSLHRQFCYIGLVFASQFLHWLTIDHLFHSPTTIEPLFLTIWYCQLKNMALLYSSWAWIEAVKSTDRWEFISWMFVE